MHVSSSSASHFSTEKGLFIDYCSKYHNLVAVPFVSLRLLKLGRGLHVSGSFTPLFLRCLSLRASRPCVSDTFFAPHYKADRLD